MGTARDGDEGEVHGPPAGYRLQSEDTSYRAERRLVAGWRTMPPHEKAAMAESLWEEARELVRCGVELRHPDAAPEEVERLVAEHLARTGRRPRPGPTPPRPGR